MAAAATQSLRARWTRRALVAAGTGGAAIGTVLPARASVAWPERPVRLVTLVAPGGGSDAVARSLAEALARRWGQPVVVDNRPGADGILAVEAFLAARDGFHTLLFANTSTVSERGARIGWLVLRSWVA
jgi:tripartite-type tricarboxylate transporter receptor subunit TctC